MEKNRKEYILIVEDSAIDFEIISRSLKMAGVDCPVYHCEDGDSALEFIAASKKAPSTQGLPKLVLLDLNMPGTDGRQVLKEIKSSKRLRKIPVMVLSTSNNTSDIDACYAEGANSYVKKPMSPEDFTQMARSVKAFWFDWVCLPGAAA